MRNEQYIYYAIEFNYKSNGLYHIYVDNTLFRTEEEARKAIPTEWNELKDETDILLDTRIKMMYPARPTEEESREAWQSLGDAYQEAMEEING